MGNHMQIYNAVRECPKEAQRPIAGGKLKGKTDINPMWRIKALTEQFGPCGLGWKIENEKFWTEPGANGEIVAWCSLELRWFDKDCGEWSYPVFGIGGSMLVDTQNGKLASNDEAYKMAYTDAISVACKALGFAADIYWEADSTKYRRREAAGASKKVAVVKKVAKCADCGNVIKDAKKPDGTIWTAADLAKYSKERWGLELCFDCSYKSYQAEMELISRADGTL